MHSRHLLLGLGLLALGLGLVRRARPRRLPWADGPVPADGGRLLQQDGSQVAAAQALGSAIALRAGMPRDRSSDADRARPGFADYARGA